MSPIDLLVSDARDVMLTSIHHKTLQLSLSNRKWVLASR
jgi:hypothetical protein